jgi:hypothetical protein
MNLDFGIRKIFGAMRESDEREMDDLLKISLGGGLTEKAISLLNDLKYAVANNAGSVALSKIAMDIYKLNENKELIN